MISPLLFAILPRFRSSDAHEEVSPHQHVVLKSKIAPAKARQLGFRRVVLETTLKLPKAIALYRAYGFQSYTAAQCAPRCDLTMELLLDPS